MGDGRLRDVVAHGDLTVRKSIIYKILKFIKRITYFIPR